MTVEDLVEKDRGFNESVFLSRVNHMMKKIYNSITLNELDTVRHFVSDSVYHEFEKELEQATALSARLIYDEVNVTSSIDSVDEVDGCFVVAVRIECKYLKYFLSLKYGTVVGGNDTVRKNASYRAVLKKKIGVFREDVSRCFGCGVSLNINDNGVCPNCGRVYDLKNIDYVIDSYQVIGAVL